MAKIPRKGRLYCSVYGCLNSSLNKPDLTFHKIPLDEKRRNEWLHLICREDLIGKNHASYKVCEVHFNEHDILPGTKYRRLKARAMPIINLPYLLRKDAEAQTIENTEPPSQEVQTEKVLPNSKNTQTAQILLLDTPVVKRLKSQISECKKQVRLNEISSKSSKVQKAALCHVSDCLLSKQLAMLVKANLKSNSQGIRYDRNYVEFCSTLYDISPAAYDFLQNIFGMPSSATLHRLKCKTEDDLEATTSKNASNFNSTDADANLDDLDADIITENLGASSAFSDDFKATKAMDLGDFPASASGLNYSDATTSTTIDKIHVTNTYDFKPTTFVTNNSTSCPETISFLQSSLSEGKSETRKEMTLETTHQSIEIKLEAADSTNREDSKPVDITNINSSVAMIVCDIPPDSPEGEYYDPLQM